MRFLRFRKHSLDRRLAVAYLFAVARFTIENAHPNVLSRQDVAGILKRHPWAIDAYVHGDLGSYR